ncbi:pyridoxal-dependent decarboxylase [Penicillium verhagenii]|nr:pyridoxal-dependent decarboxylase [Penicillium verhagenii]
MDSGWPNLPGFLAKEHMLLESEKIIRPAANDQLAQISKISIPGSARRLEDVLEDAKEIFSLGFRVGNPRFFSFVPSPASPWSWVGDSLTSAYNPFGGCFEAASGVCQVEETLIAWVAEQFGLPKTAGGQFVSGGSIANLTALTVARDQLLEDGEARLKGVAYISSQTHFCIKKALKIMGLSDHQVRVIDVDNNFCINTALLEQAILNDIESGLKPFVVIATCGTTNTGSIDPLAEISAITKTYGMWMHVDAAFGGSVAFSYSRRDVISGIGHADSIAWDAHKWLFQTHGCGAAIFREKSKALKSFASTATYVQDVDECADQNPWNYGIELTRPARHMRLWFSLQVMGMEMIDQMISHGFAISEYAEEELRKCSGWEILSSSSLAILNFRFAPLGLKEPTLDAINTQISSQLMARNVAVIFTTKLNGMVSLRMCTINPETTRDDIADVVKALDDAAKEILTQIGLNGV